MFHGIIAFISGIWLVVWALILRTENIESSILFKIFPFFIGLVSLYSGVKLLGWI